jgi:hypothetical protein
LTCFGGLANLTTSDAREPVGVVVVRGDDFWKAERSLLLEVGGFSVGRKRLETSWRLKPLS